MEQIISVEAGHGANRLAYSAGSHVLYYKRAIQTAIAMDESDQLNRVCQDERLGLMTFGLLRTIKMEIWRIPTAERIVQVNTHAWRDQKGFSCIMNFEPYISPLIVALSNVVKTRVSLMASL